MKLVSFYPTKLSWSKRGEMDSNSMEALLQLQKLSAMDSEEAIDKLLSVLWKSRKSGLPHADKSNLQSLLRLPSLSDVDPVVASLRVLIEKCLREDYSSNGVLKLLPPGLSVDLQSTLVMLLQKYQVQWKEEMARDQHSLPRTNLPYQTSAAALSSLISFPSSEISTQLWPQHDDPAMHLNQSDIVGPAPMIADSLHLGVMTNQHDIGPTDSMGALPRFKSMTWTLENKNSAVACRVAIISLKSSADNLNEYFDIFYSKSLSLFILACIQLLDYSNSPVGEMEVKFQLTRDTLEAMLRSLSYISDQFSRIAGSSSGPMQKKQKQ